MNTAESYPPPTLPIASNRRTMRGSVSLSCTSTMSHRGLSLLLAASKYSDALSCGGPAYVCYVSVYLHVMWRSPSWPARRNYTAHTLHPKQRTNWKWSG